MYTIYSAAVCPFAQRTRALLTHLEAPFELLEVDLKNRPPRLLELSPTGKVPLLVDGEFVLYESQVINDYLAESLGWSEAYSTNLRLRARQRLAMKQWDSGILPAAFSHALGGAEGFSDEQRTKVGKELDQLGHTVSDSPVESMLAFHLAPFWARMDWLREFSPVTGLVDERPALLAWLEDAVALPAVTGTLPERDSTVERYRSRYVERSQG